MQVNMRQLNFLFQQDVKNKNILQEVDAVSDEYLRKVRDLTPEQRRDEMEKIQKMFKKAKAHGEDKVRRHDTQHNDDIQPNDTQHNDTKYVVLSVSNKSIMLSVVMLNVVTPEHRHSFWAWIYSPLRP